MPIHHSEAAPPPHLPPHYRGFALLHERDRLIYWTGRVAIGLRYDPPRTAPITRAEEFAQRQLLQRRAA